MNLKATISGNNPLKSTRLHRQDWSHQTFVRMNPMSNKARRREVFHLELRFSHNAFSIQNSGFKTKSTKIEIDHQTSSREKRQLPFTELDNRSIGTNIMH
jgi:hypothetical protein